MYVVTVRDHVMVAHSLTGEVFGPAQALHGATFTVEAGVRGERLDEHGILVDIAVLTDVVRAVLDPIRYRNLDEVPQLAGRNTTTEVLAEWIAARLVDEVRSGALAGARGRLSGVVVTLHESHLAWASCELAIEEVS